MKTFNKIAAWSSCFLLMASCALQAQDVKNAEKSCQKFVQEFYNSLVKEENSSFDRIIKSKRSALSPELFQLLKEDTEAQAKVSGEIVGLDFDPFFNSQDPAKHYVVGEIRHKDEHYWVDVYDIQSGEKSKTPSVVPELIFDHGKWLFVNFHYGKSQYPENENLLSILKCLQKDRKKSSE